VTETSIATDPAAAAPHPVVLPVLAEIPKTAWARLAERALEPNVFYDPLWAPLCAAQARGRTGARALAGFDRNRLIALLPVVPAMRALCLPLPLLVSWQGYARVTAPLLDGDEPDAAADALLAAARSAGAFAILLRDVPLDGAAMTALRAALARRGRAPRVLRSNTRALLDARANPERLLRDALGPKKLKELRRQRHRLNDQGDVTFAVAAAPDDVAQALEGFLALEASGWKGRRGTALVQHPGDAIFIRRAALALAREGRCQIATLSRGADVLAAGIILRQGTRGFFFKLAYDETERKTSPGVQLTLELTRHLCADATITEVDSTADADHPMIDHIWRGRMTVADVLLPLRGQALVRPLEWLIRGSRPSA
jgi:CelD/BcsL family acetyltransferase involved in cellulose biosynthesis